MFPFNVRVYGLLLHKGKVLVADEERNGFQFTKFPGGGLEFGEGTIDTLKREFQEEGLVLNDDLQFHHFYTTDFFQDSAFNKDHQVISIYYLVNNFDGETIPVSTKPFDFGNSMEKEKIIFRWVSLEDITSEIFTFPIDKKVALLLKDQPNLF